jgi:hypothetical protein
MIRSFAYSGVVVVLASAALYTSGNSAASPSDQNGTCTFELISPKVVPVSGSDMVIASVKAGPCTMAAAPLNITVCLSIEGDDSNGDCSAGARAAQVYYQYRPGATYIAKGQGCASILKPPYRLCQDIPASSVTL